MNDQLIIFIIGFSLAAIGTLPPGLINIHAMERSINKGVFYGFLLSLGAVIVEWGQIWVSYKVASSIGTLGRYALPIQICSVVIFLSIAVYYFLKKPAKLNVKKVKIKTDLSFVIGMFLSSINLLAIPYWIFYITFLKNKGFMNYNMVDFHWIALGGVLGALLVLMMYVYLGKILQQNMNKWKRISDYIIGGIFIILAGIQLIQVIQAIWPSSVVVE